MTQNTVDEQRRTHDKPFRRTTRAVCSIAWFCLRRRARQTPKQSAEKQTSETWAALVLWV